LTTAVKLSFPQTMYVTALLTNHF
jgi:coiled-coil domain-containing protein 40